MIIPSMSFIPRLIEQKISESLVRGKSVLLLGPRQTGKTTLVQQCLKPDISYSFTAAHLRQRYEADVSVLEAEIVEQIHAANKPPLIFIDEVQKIPRVMDVVQGIIDNKLATFILSGSSARKLKHGREINLLPGRVVSLAMPPLLYSEMIDIKPSLEELLLYGTLPSIVTEANKEHKETDLYSYVTTYLEEEIRAEAVVRNVGSFTRFLEIAAGEAGKTVNSSRLSQDVGVADTTIRNYYQILEDCMIVNRIDPISNSHTRRRLIKSPKYLYFDLGIRRACANEGTRLPQQFLGHLFEQFVGNELLFHSQLKSPQIKLRYWRDTAGPEVDYVLEYARHYIPIEVKWSDRPSESDAKHILKLSADYSITNSYIVCRTPRRYKLNNKITVIPWQDIAEIFDELR